MINAIIVSIVTVTLTGILFRKITLVTLRAEFHTSVSHYARQRRCVQVANVTSAIDNSQAANIELNVARSYFIYT